MGRDYMQQKKLSFFEASSIITGFGVGGGIMAVPYLASLNGLTVFLALLIAAYLLSMLIHLMIAETLLRDSSTGQLVELFGKFLFRGRGGVIFTWIFFVLIILAFYANLSAYLAGGGEIISELACIPLWAGHCITYAIAAGVVFFGLKAIGISEKYAVIAMLICVGILSAASLLGPIRLNFAVKGHLKEGLALFGMIMFAFSALFSVPQAVEGLHWNRKLVPKAVIAGMGVNLFITLVITFMVIGVPGEVTRVAMIGWGRAIGDWAFIFGNLFILLALLTSYWAVSFALAVVFNERLKLGDKPSWLFATLPTLVIVLARFTDFIGFMGIAGSAIALLVAILVVPTMRGARKYGDIRDPEWTLGFFGNSFFQALVIIGFIITAAGSAIIPSIK